MDERAIVDPAAIERLKEWGGEELPKKMISLFLEHSPGRMEQIRTGSASRELRSSETGAHSLKSSAGNVGALRLQALAEKAEFMAEAGDHAGLEEILPALERAYGEAESQLRNLLEGMNG